MYQALGVERIKASDALNHAIGIVSIMIFSRHLNNRYPNVPGEIIKALKPEYRSALECLKSSDISEEKLPREIGKWVAEENAEEKLLRTLKLEFDKKIHGA